MSEFTNKSKQRVEQLTTYMFGLMNQENGKTLLDENNILETRFIPSDILEMFDVIFDKVPDMDALKSASNKLFNILYKNLTEYPAIEAPENTFIAIMQKNNRGAVQWLNETKTYIKQINNKVESETISILSFRFKELQKFLSHYVIKENILFPLIEKKWANNACLKLMWSFHDDIRTNMKKTLQLLEDETFDLNEFNRISSKVYFNINTIVFREERILFPILLETFNNSDFEDMLHQAVEIGFHFVPDIKIKTASKPASFSDQLIQFGTGEISPEQIELIFNHLPVDITFVDEHDTVKYFSTPKHRIFPRSTGIIGRKVQNCHPHESVNVVEKIVQSFKNGEKDLASFWIHMGSNFVLIQYYAVRDSKGKYHGVLEVSQEISEIQKISGDKKLLDWE